MTEKGGVCKTSKISAKTAQSAAKRPQNSQQKKVESELRKLREITKEALPPDKRKLVMPMLANIAWMKVKLDQARIDLLCEPLVSVYDNGGGQSGTRENPGIRVYNQLFVTYSRAVKQICDLIPTEHKTERDALLDYMNDEQFG